MVIVKKEWIREWLELQEDDVYVRFDDKDDYEPCLDGYFDIEYLAKYLTGMLNPPTHTTGKVIPCVVHSGDTTTVDLDKLMEAIEKDE